MGPVQSFEIRPIAEESLDSVNPKCWENRETQRRILSKQGILGFGAWDDAGVCIAQLHCYEVRLPDWDDTVFPGYARNRLEDWPLGWPLLAARDKGLAYLKPVWGLSCFHVGLLPGVFDADPRYSHRGIGSALLNASVSWALDHEYAAVLAHGGSHILPQYNVWMGCLPWKAYYAVGFKTIAFEEDAKRLPWWKAKDHPELIRQLEEELTRGRALEDLCARCMVLEL